MQKTKKQHYVPRCYLKMWSTSDNQQVYVYDKVKDEIRKNSIRDVAAEGYFYDIKPTEFFTDDYLKVLRENGINICEDSTQLIEHALAEEFENPFSQLLNKIIDRTKNLTIWHIKNCFSILEEEKTELAAYLAIQFIRTKRIRTGIQDSADCLTQILADMGVPNSTIEKYSMTKEQAKNAHLSMLLDVENLDEITTCFLNLKWFVGINRTDKKFYTTDNAIGTQGHIKDPIRSMNGIASRGVEVFYPLSPDVILIMVDGGYHTTWQPFERRYIEITEAENIDYYNSILSMQAGRFIISCDNDFSLLKQMKSQNPDVFNQPSTQVTWGGETYYPRKRI